MTTIKSKANFSLSEKHYSHDLIEPNIYQYWKDNNVFSCNPESSKPPFSMVIPPPNVTGGLHMGHALNNSIQDCLCRYKRMDGFDVLWVPGTDHAGISTQSIVKKHLDAEGIDFYQYGRENVIKKIWKWKEKFGDQILLQLETLGVSCDWSHLRFTMDEGLSKAVKTAFCSLYEKGLIYRGKYIVNWCPVDRTALSDDEVNTTEGGEPGFLWHIEYPVKNSSEKVTIATTRPETMLGDVAVAVNPKDERYQHLIGQTLSLPLSDREIPVIGDDYVDRNFGSGWLKVTHAHDPNDFQIGLRHNLPQINVMNEDASIGDQAPAKYHGLDRFECREKIVEELKNLGLLSKIEERMTPVVRAERSKAIIEYRLSDQWFVKMKPLAEKALQASENDEIKLFPEKWEQVYRHWLENTRDWCISRQIWWGHQIPAWYNIETDEILVSKDVPEQVKENPDLWKQDEDVLDTWFSSALWPYSTLGWPEETFELKKYYPTSVLTTAKDIIYFWVARMVMTGLNFMGKVPFREVYFHPVICDEKGETMSKSKGNGIDPLHVIRGASTEELKKPILIARPGNMDEMLEQIKENFPQGLNGVGADALRITLFSLNSQSQQVQLSYQKFDEIGRRFVDKLWNASRFVISKIEEGSIAKDINKSELSLEDKWILGKLDKTIEKVRKSFESYHFHEAISTLQSFFWEDFCDWYLELTKESLKDKNSENAKTKRLVLTEVYIQTLKLLHPITPFITEELWLHLTENLKNKLPDSYDNGILALSSYPKVKNFYSEEIENKFSILQNIVKSLRNVRSELGLPAHRPVPVSWNPLSTSMKEIINENLDVIIKAASLESFTEVTDKPGKTITSILNDLELYTDITDVIDIDSEIKRNEKQISKLSKELESISKRLENPKFLDKAPKEVIEETSLNRSNLENKISKIKDILSELKS